ncbi:hypothetical protein TNCV_3119991 [Trichonephila clavipes]|uniref:Uncharacterized protein n=1 Tax=Trichonephila clavipes TaxID=2585209 RepID=A0A8X6WAG4_TRICX|nr:hypothetical protein TNCV_3119991 [Trichonephila clavipes]
MSRAFLRHGSTLNSRRAVNPLVRLVERERCWRPLTTTGIGVELSQTVPSPVWFSKIRLTTGVRLSHMFPMWVITPPCGRLRLSGASKRPRVRWRLRWYGRDLKWAAHLVRMNEDRFCKKTFLVKCMENRPRGRPPLRWIDYVGKDLIILKVKNWRTLSKSRSAWRKLLEKAKAHPGLSRNSRRI